MASVDKFKRQFEAFASATDAQRIDARRDRDYRDHKQWTSAEVEKLSERGQAPVVINRIAPKIDYMIGVERAQRQDPKAWPRTPGDEGAAEAATDALRYIADNTGFDTVSNDCYENLLVEGIEAAIVEYINDEISISQVPYDRLYYDPHSTKRDFSDAEYIGLAIWMDAENAKEMFKGKDEDIENALNDYSIDEGFDDKPRWVDKSRKRVKVCQHYYKEKGVWHVVYFSGDVELIKAKESPYKDEDGNPVCPIIVNYLYKTRENECYGWARQFIWIQDEINHRRSKALNILSRRTVIMDRGAVDDVHYAKEELTRADGVIEKTPGLEFTVDPGQDLAQGQLGLLQEAKQEIDAIAKRTEIGAGASGRARMLAGSNDMLEVGPILGCHRAWKLGVYRQVWMRVKQFWDTEKWVRVTDNEDNLKFIGLNRPITYGENLKERANQGDEQAAQDLQILIAAQDPRLNEVEEVSNDVAKMDLDITLGEVQDAANIQVEQLEMLVNLAQVYGPQAVPFETVVEMTQLRNKKEILDKLKGGDNPNAAAQQQIAMMQVQQQMEKLQAEIDKMRADTAKKQAETEHIEQQTVQTAVETQVIATQPVSGVTVAT